MPADAKKKRRSKRVERPPSSVLKELQSVVATQFYLLMYDSTQSGIGTLDEARQHHKIEELYFGNSQKEIASQLRLMLDGRGVYGEVFEQRADDNSDEGIEIRPSVHRHEGKSFVPDLHFSFELLKRSSLSRKDRITGRTLVRMAQESLANFKKIASLVDLADFTSRSPDGEVIFASGQQEEPDLDSYLLDRIFNWKGENGKESGEAVDSSKATSLEDEKEEDSSESEAARSDKWLPRGWFVWKSRGGLSICIDHCVDIGQFAEAANPDEGGRTVARRMAAAMKTAERSAGVGSGRGVSFGASKKEVAAGAMQEDQAMMRKVEADILSTQAVISSMQNRLQSIIAEAKLYHDMKMTKEAKSLMTEARELRLEIKEEELKMTNMRSQKRVVPDVVEHFLNDGKNAMGVKRKTPPKDDSNELSDDTDTDE